MALKFSAFENPLHLFEQIESYAIYMIDPRGTVLTWNRGAESISGYRAD